MPDTNTGTEASQPNATPAPSGIVAFDTAVHNEAKKIFAKMKDKITQGADDLDEEINKLAKLLRL